MTPREYGQHVQFMLQHPDLEKEALLSATQARRAAVYARRAARYAGRGAQTAGQLVGDAATAAGGALGNAAGRVAGNISGAAGHYGPRLAEAISDAATGINNATGRFTSNVVVPTVLRGGEMTKDVLYHGGKHLGGALGHALAGLGGVGMYGAGLGSQYVLSPAIRGVGHLLTNILGGSATLAGRTLRGSAFSKNPLARTAQTLTGAGMAGAGGYAAYDAMSDK